MKNIKLTIFTPTYNREKQLSKCYESLLEQTSKNFVWQVIDDGSTDETEKFINKMKADEMIDIIYIKKENGGKVSAINLSLERCSTELWVCLDSDDFLTNNAVEIILKNYEKIKYDEKVCGLIALRSNPDFTPMHKLSIPRGIKYATLRKIRYELGIPPEYVFAYKTNIISQYPYPIIKGEKFMALSYVFDQIDQKYKYLVMHEPLMVCEYFEDGISKNKRKLIKKNPKGYTIYKRQALELSPNLKLRIKECILYITGCILSNDKNCINNSPYKFLTILCYPLGWLLYMNMYRKNN
ncbi:glycosyltransferase [Clostridium sp.]|uniref:glycosyltransferase family 2 protein n=1 Tax=Clostridium sp. TaxID=1506 RepID=UPI003216F737